MTFRLVSYWDSPVTWLERLCVASMVDKNHDVTIFSYDPKSISGRGLDAEIRDAREIICSHNPSYRYRDVGEYSLFSNIFRLYIQDDEQSVWVDLDCFMVKPLEIENQFIFGFSSPGKINGAVLKLPHDSEMLADYRKAITADPLRVPWATFSRRVKREVEILLGKTQPSPHFKSNIGPRALTYFARRHGLTSYAQSQEVFYPLTVSEAYLLAGPQEIVRSKLTEATVIVHAWASTLKARGYANQIPGENTFLGRACREFSVT